MDQKLILRLSAIISGISGVVILVSVFYPIISYESVYGKNFSELVSPLNENPINKEDGTDVGGTNDYTRASNWFVGGAKSSEFETSKVQHFTITIPALKIIDATVTIGGEDLNESLIQYPGTALPGRPGNTVVFGHSILPIFYNPKNYISIFSLLPTLKVGDEIKINYDGITYLYEIETMFEVMPTDLQVLDQDYSDSFVTLVTCVPPGHPSDPKRLIVRARIVPPTD